VKPLHQSLRSLTTPLVSIVIPNFNYADFVGMAIRSALDQSYPAIEVIVVDDGSTDRSRRVIERFGEQIRPIFKANGGQTSTTNVGWLAAKGEIVLFLDADDALSPNAVEKIVEAMRPGVVAVQFCLATIDPEGRPLGGVYPPLPDDWTPQRIRECVLETGFYPFPPTSGNAYARWFLDKVMPVPPERMPRGTDGVLNAVAPLYGDVIVLKDALGFYRIHGSNMGALTELEPEKFSYFVDLDRRRGAFLLETARSLGIKLDPAVLDRAFFYLQYRVASCKLRPDLHPLPGDRLYRLPWMLARAAMIAPDRTLLRAFVGAWGFAVALAPRPLAAHLVAMRFISGRRPKLIDGTLRVLGLVRRTKTPDKAAAPALAAE
jgi:glycosyltransferase involved in cell wall biosynthesis